MRLDGAVAAFHGAYPWWPVGFDDAWQEREIPQKEHQAYDPTITLNNKPIQGAQHSSLGAHRDDLRSNAKRSLDHHHLSISLHDRLSHNDPITRFGVEG